MTPPATPPAGGGGAINPTPSNLGGATGTISSGGTVTLNVPSYAGSPGEINTNYPSALEANPGGIDAVGASGSATGGSSGEPITHEELEAGIDEIMAE